MATSCISTYQSQLISTINSLDTKAIAQLYDALLRVWKDKQQVFICGNGGSAANAAHIANDFSYGVNPNGRAFSIESLAANEAITTCLANDTGYHNIFAKQLINKAKQGDLLIVLSGSGNSGNIIHAVEAAKELKLTTCGILGFDGGTLKNMVDIAIHCDINDMQISEDMQLVIGHILMKDLSKSLQNL